MLLKGLPRAQLLLPSWTARNLAFVQQQARKSSDRKSDGETQVPDGVAPSLFEELFPEESKDENKARRSPTIIGDLNGLPRVESIKRTNSTKLPRSYKLVRHIPAKSKRPLFSTDAQKDSGRDPGADQYQFREHRDASVLILSNASKSLALSDFLRLSPQGEHIDGWASGIIKVIPGRDPHTLEAQGHYFILFSTDAAARAYMDKFTRLHRISQIHTASSITSPLPPPPGYLKDGEDLHALMQAFTLIPSSQHHPSIRMLRKPFRPAMQRMIAEGGHPSIAARQSKSEDLVLLSLDKGHIEIYDLRAAIGRDGKERNLRWNLLSGKDDIVRLDGGKAMLEEGEEKEMEVLQGMEEKKRKRWQPSRFILSFKDNQEARRFVRAWHRRPIPLIQGPQNPEDEVPPIVNAELLW